jgi:CRISPR-associated endonuclease Csn1
MHNDTAYGLLGGGHVQVRKRVEGVRIRETAALKVIEFADRQAHPRHGLLPNGEPRPYKGYKGDSNYCMEIVRTEKGKWEGEVVSTFEAYQLVRQHGLARLRHPALSVSGRPLVMRLLRNDTLRLDHNGEQRTVRICKMTAEGVIALADTTESNVDARTRTKDLSYIFKTAGSLQKSKGRRVAISPSGEMKDPGFFD